MHKRIVPTLEDRGRWSQLLGAVVDELCTYGREHVGVRLRPLLDAWSAGGREAGNDFLLALFSYLERNEVSAGEVPHFALVVESLRAAQSIDRTQAHAEHVWANAFVQSSIHLLQSALDRWAQGAPLPPALERLMAWIRVTKPSSTECDVQRTLTKELGEVLSSLHRAYGTPYDRRAISEELELLLDTLSLLGVDLARVSLLTRQAHMRRQGLRVNILEAGEQWRTVEDAAWEQLGDHRDCSLYAALQAVAAAGDLLTEGEGPFRARSIEEQSRTPPMTALELLRLAECHIAGTPAFRNLRSASSDLDQALLRASELLEFWNRRARVMVANITRALRESGEESCVVVVTGAHAERIGRALAENSIGCQLLMPSGNGHERYGLDAYLRLLHRYPNATTLDDILAESPPDMPQAQWRAHSDSVTADRPEELTLGQLCLALRAVDLSCPPGPAFYEKSDCAPPRGWNPGDNTRRCNVRYCTTEGRYRPAQVVCLRPPPADLVTWCGTCKIQVCARCALRRKLTPPEWQAIAGSVPPQDIRKARAQIEPTVLCCRRCGLPLGLPPSAEPPVLLS